MLDTQLSDTDFSGYLYASPWCGITIPNYERWHVDQKSENLVTRPARVLMHLRCQPQPFHQHSMNGFSWENRPMGKLFWRDSIRKPCHILICVLNFDSRTPWPRASASQWFPWCSAPPCSLENSWRVNFSSLPLMLFLHAAQRCVLSKFSCSPILFLVARACVDLNKPLFISSWSFIR